MTATLVIHRAGPAMTVQDLGRPGHMGEGLSMGGAADRTAFIEGVALLGQSLECAAIEMASFGGEFSTSADVRIALTGAPMRATLEGDALAWNASHFVKAGQRLSIGAAKAGVYGYLHVGGGLKTGLFLGSRATHLTAGIGEVLGVDQHLEIGVDGNCHDFGNAIAVPDARFTQSVVRVLPSVQTRRFPKDVLERFEETVFHRTPRGNRQGVELAFDGLPFATDAQLTILSEPMVAGDIQMTGEGAPFVLLPECQTTGGYPRIGTVLPCDLPIVSQAQPGSDLQFQFVAYEKAIHFYRSPSQSLHQLIGSVRPLIRDPHNLRDLLAYQLIGGVVNALEDCAE